MAAEEALDAGRAEAVEGRRVAVDRLLQGGKVSEALQAALENPPINTKSKEIKVRKGIDFFHNDHLGGSVTG